MSTSMSHGVDHLASTIRLGAGAQPSDQDLGAFHVSTTHLDANLSYTILLIDADSPDRRATCSSLIQEGYRLVEARNASEALALTAAIPTDLVILDLEVPGAEGLKLIGQIRNSSTAHLTVVSHFADDAHKLAAFDAGADEYLVKPVVVPELLARLRVAARRMPPRSLAAASAVILIGDLKIDRLSRQTFVGKKEIKLTPTERRLLDLLAANAGKPLTHGFLLTEIWGPESVDDVQYLRVSIASLRRKIEANPHRPQYILTEQRVGYRLSSNGRSTDVSQS